MIQLQHDAVAQVLADPDTSGLVVFMVAAATIGPEFLGEDAPPMDPALVWAELNQAYGIWIPEESENRVQALMTVAENPGAFENDVDVFLVTTSALWDGDIDDVIDGVFDGPDFEELVWSVFEVELLRGEAADFSPAIQAIMAKTMTEDAAEDAEEVQADVVYRAARMLEDLEACGFGFDTVNSLRARAEKQLGSLSTAEASVEE